MWNVAFWNFFLTKTYTFQAFRRFLAVNDAMEYKDRFIRKIMTQPLLTAPLITKSRLLLYFDTVSSWFSRKKNGLN
jgi:hypothetical protein